MNSQGFPILASVARSNDRGWVKQTTSTEMSLVQLYVYVGSSSPLASDFVSHTSDYLSWAFSQRFEARIDRALSAIESGHFDAVNTIDELIEYIDAQGKEAQG